MIVPKYYKVFRTRVEFEKLLYGSIKNDEYLIKILKLFFIK
jgi:hypothetical protein